MTIHKQLADRRRRMPRRERQPKAGKRQCPLSAARRGRCQRTPREAVCPVCRRPWWSAFDPV